MRNMRWLALAIVGGAGFAAMGLTIVTTLAGTLEVIETVSLEDTELRITLEPGAQVRREFTLNNSSARSVWAGLHVTVDSPDGTPAWQVVQGTDRDFIAEIPPLGSLTWGHTFRADNGAPPGVYDLTVQVIRPDDTVIANYLASSAGVAP